MSENLPELVSKLYKALPDEISHDDLVLVLGNILLNMADREQAGLLLLDIAYFISCAKAQEPRHAH